MRKFPLRKRIAFILVANLAALGAIALIGEVVCRLFSPQADYQAVSDADDSLLRFADDLYLGFQLRADVADHNSAGFRGRHYNQTKPDSVWRIVAIGDSVTYGLGVEASEAFPGLLEARLNQTADESVEVLNFGPPGYNTFQASTLLQTRAIQYEPDLVVLTFTPDDVETSPVIIDVDGQMCLFRNQLEGVGLFNNSVHWAVFRRSHFYRLLYKGATLASRPSGTDFNDVYVQPEVAWENVRRVDALCRREQTAFLLVLSPWLRPHFRPADDANPDDLEAPEMLLDLEVMQRYEQAFDEIRRFARQSDVDFLDLGPLYEEQGGKMKLMPMDHEHLGPLGNRLVAEALCEKVLSMRDAGEVRP